LKSRLRVPLVSSLALLCLLALGNAISSVSAEAQMFRWDTALLTTPMGVPTISAAGNDFALAVDSTTILIRGTGTFGGGVPPTGEGFWSTNGPSGTASGHFTVTGLVSFVPAPGTLPPVVVDKIGANANARSGLAVLRISYSDGSKGTLTISCQLPVGAPSGLFEGITATKGYVDFWNRVPPLPGYGINRTLFHIIP
jgi:hypothetical protein